VTEDAEQWRRFQCLLKEKNILTNSGAKEVLRSFVDQREIEFHAEVVGKILGTYASEEHKTKTVLEYLQEAIPANNTRTRNLLRRNAQN